MVPRRGATRPSAINSLRCPTRWLRTIESHILFLKIVPPAEGRQANPGPRRPCQILRIAASRSGLLAMMLRSTPGSRGYTAAIVAAQMLAQTGAFALDRKSVV